MGVTPHPLACHSSPVCNGLGVDLLPCIASHLGVVDGSVLDTPIPATYTPGALSREALRGCALALPAGDREGHRCLTSGVGGSLCHVPPRLVDGGGYGEGGPDLTLRDVRQPLLVGSRVHRCPHRLGGNLGVVRPVGGEERLSLGAHHTGSAYLSVLMCRAAVTSTRHFSPGWAAIHVNACRARSKRGKSDSTPALGSRWPS